MGPRADRGRQVRRGGTSPITAVPVPDCSAPTADTTSARPESHGEATNTARREIMDRLAGRQVGGLGVHAAGSWSRSAPSGIKPAGITARTDRRARSHCQRQVPQCTRREPIDVSATTVGCPHVRQGTAIGFGNRIRAPPTLVHSPAGYGAFAACAAIILRRSFACSVIRRYMLSVAARPPTALTSRL
jgi:hypothetical protein